MNYNLQRKNIVKWIQDNCKRNVVIGISGGRDSMVAAALCVEALGNERVFGLLLPYGAQKDIADSFTVCRHLDISYRIYNIKTISEFTFDQIQNAHLKLSDRAKFEFPSRIRTAVLYAYAQSMDADIVNTNNACKLYINSYNKYGDADGDIQFLRKYTSDDIIEIGKLMNLPEEILFKPPADGLSDKTDEEVLGFTYHELSEYIRTGKATKETKELIENLKNQEDRMKVY